MAGTDLARIEQEFITLLYMLLKSANKMQTPFTVYGFRLQFEEAYS